MTLGMDYLAQTEAVSEVDYFVHEHQEQLDSFGRTIRRYRADESTHGQREVAHRELSKIIKPNDNEIKVRALSMAGGLVLRSQLTLHEQFNELAEEGALVSAALVRYISKHQPGTTQLPLNNTAYRFIDDYLGISLAMSKLKTVPKRMTVFADGPDLRAITQRMYEWKDDDKLRLYATGVPPTINDWENLLRDITTTVRF